MDGQNPKKPAAALALVALLGAVPAQAAASAKGLDRISSIEPSNAGIVIHGTTAAAATAFKLLDPPRVVVDLAGADVSRLASPLDVTFPGVLGVTATQFDEGGTKVGRIVFALSRDTTYDVRSAGTDLVVHLGDGQPAGASPQAKPAVLSGSATPPATDVVRTMGDKRSVSHPSTTLKALRVRGDDTEMTVDLQTNGELAQYELLELRSPGRLALDLPGLTKGASLGRPSPNGLIREIRTAPRGSGLRVVLVAATERAPAHEVEWTRQGLRIRLHGSAADQKVSTQQTSRPGVGARVVGEAKVARALIPIRSIELRTDGGATRVVVAADGPIPFDLSHPSNTTAVMTLHGALLPERLERNLDAQALGAPVTLLSSYRGDAPGEVKIVATIKQGTDDGVDVLRNALTWHFGGRTVAQASKARPLAAAMAADSVYDSSQYSGRRVDFNAKDSDITSLLGVIAEISKRNIIVTDEVKGTVTIKLRQVPWEQALDIILRSKNLGREDVGNIIRIAPLETLRKEHLEAADSKKREEELKPLKVRLIPVNYASADSLRDRVKESLSSRGTVGTDARTNTLIVKDIQEGVARAEGIVRILDTQTPEVLIESRIVEAGSSFSREAGIQWGGNVSLSPSTGNATGLSFPNVLSVAGATDDPASPLNGLTGVSTPNFVVNMPAPIGLNNGAGLGFIFGSAGGAANLNLRLSAYENSGTIKTISSPRVVTIDNSTASIGQGISIPFSQVSASGVATSFIEAKLQLSVTPHVTPEGAVQMKIEATNNQPNPQLTGSNGQPSISKREARTDVLVKDGDTTVIGGIYTRRSSEAWKEVPILSKIPVLGWLFKKKAVSDDRTELLIFITPRIVNRAQSIVSSSSLEDKPQ